MVSTMMDEYNLVVDGAPFLMRGAEIHYFRTPKNKWRSLLRRSSELGINTITACVPWFFHEIEEGRFDFDGTTLPERDICGFIDAVAEEGLKFVAHPGPFINCEFRFGGIPEWLFRNHPETLSLKADGECVPGRGCPAEGEPLYRSYVRKWYEAVVPLFAERQADDGGPVILFQPDNELSAGWSYGLLNSLYDQVTLGERWPAWLQKRFGVISGLNDCLESDYRDFESVEPPRSFPSKRFEKTLAHLWMEFKRWFFADWGCTMAAWAKELGMRVPMIFNEPVAGFYGHGDHPGFGNVLLERGVEGASVCHSYSPRIMDLEGLFNPISGLELVKSSPWGGPPMSVEINCNWFIPRLSLSAINWSPLVRTLLGRGLKGYSVFTFAEAAANLADSIEGQDYFQGTCVDIDGKVSEAGKQIARFNDLLSTWNHLITAAKPSSDALLAFSPAARVVDFLGAERPIQNGAELSSRPGGDAFDAEPSLDDGGGSAGHDWLDGYENVTKQTTLPESGIWGKLKEAFLALNRLNVSFGMLDMSHPNAEPGIQPLIVPCVGTLEEISIDYLVEHLDRGGKALFFPAVPTFTTEGRPDARIADKLELRLAEQVRPAGGDLLDYGSRVLKFRNGDVSTVRGWINIHEFPDECEQLAFFEGKTVVAKIADVVVSGIDFQYTTAASLRFWEAVLADALDIRPTVRTEGNYLHTSLLTAGDGSLLAVTNINGDPSPSILRLRDSDLEFSAELAPHEARILPVGTQLDGHAIVYSTSEITRPRDSHVWLLHGACGTFGELVFRENENVMIDGAPCELERTPEGYVLRYTHARNPRELKFNRNRLV